MILIKFLIAQRPGVYIVIMPDDNDSIMNGINMISLHVIIFNPTFLYNLQIVSDVF